MNATKVLITACLIIGLPAAAQASSIAGKVSYEGALPKLRPINMNADPICMSHHTGEVIPPVLEIGDGQTMGNVFIHITKGIPNKSFPAPTEPVEIDQAGCMYHPHVVGVMVGQPVKILNPDGTLHNVHAMSKINPEFNLAMPNFRKETTKTFDKPEFMFPIKCDVHPWMGAWISVMSHPFFDVTEKDGIYKIDNLPAGTYTVEAWHEKLGTKTVEVELAADENKTIDFSFSRP